VDLLPCLADIEHFAHRWLSHSRPNSFFMKFRKATAS
jgi:hypothetical protein